MSAPTRLRRLAPYALVCTGGVFLFQVAAQFDFHRRAGTLGPDFWPKLVLGLLIIVCAWKIARIALAQTPRDKSTGVMEEITLGINTIPAAEEAEMPQPHNHPWRLLAGMATTLAYVALIATTGFFLSTAIYLAAFLAIGGYRNIKNIAVLGAGGALLLMFIFMKLVYVSLPIGSGPFAQITILLMKLMGIR